MAGIELLPLALISMVVCAGAVLQVATGVGLGLLAGPVLILVLPKDTAIFVAIVLNLLLSLALLPQERRQIHWRFLRPLLVGTLIGIPVGWFVLQQISTIALTRLAGIVVLAAAVQLFFDRGGGETGNRRTGLRVVLAGGGVSGFMSGSMAIPGPVAMWALLQSNIEPTALRATLRAMFVVSYAAAFGIHFAFGDAKSMDWGAVALLLPALLVGVLLGIAAKNHIGAATLNMTLKILLVAIAGSLLWKGFLNAAT